MFHYTGGGKSAITLRLRSVEVKTVSVRVYCDKEPTERAVSNRLGNGAAALDDEVVQRISVGARYPEHRTYAKWASFR